MNKYFFILLSLLFTNLLAQDRLPENPAVYKGKLDNGIVFLIYPSQSSPGLADFRLVVNSGTANETQDQAGYAHFCEHMAFNGTSAYPENKLRDYMNDLGYGSSSFLNASTNLYETVYMLTSPVGKKKQIDHAVKILSEWATSVSFNEEKVQKEKGIILAEIAERNGFFDRYLQVKDSLIYHDQPQPYYHVLGNIESISKASGKSLKDYYKKWYKPELMAIIICGDINPEKTIKMIHKHFDTIPTNKTLAPLNPVYAENESLLIKVLYNNESLSNNFSIVYRDHYNKISTMDEYKNLIMKNLSATIINSRLQILCKDPANNLSSAVFFSGFNRRNAHLSELKADFTFNKGKEAFNAISQLLKSIEEKGVSEEEMEYSKKSMMNIMAYVCSEDKKVTNELLTQILTIHYLQNLPNMNPQQDSLIIANMLKSLTTADLNLFIKSLLSKNPFILFTLNSYNQKIPDILEIKDNYNHPVSPNLINSREIRKVDFLAPKSSGKIISREYLKDSDITILTLSNKQRVIYKKTAFKNTQICFEILSPGGKTLLNSSIWKSTDLLSKIINNSEIQGFTSEELRVFKNENMFQIDPKFNRGFHGFTGEINKDHFEKALQYLHYRFDPLCIEEMVFNKLKLDFLQNQKIKLSDPDQIFKLKADSLLYNGHPSILNLTDTDTINLNLKDFKEEYDRLFTQNDQFTYYFTGALPDDFELLVVKYLGSKDTITKQFKPKYDDFQVSYGKKTLEFIKGNDKKIQIRLLIPQKAKEEISEYSHLTALANLLSICLHERLREQISGIYSIQVNILQDILKETTYTTQINLICNSDKKDEIIQSIFQIFNEIKKGEINPKYINTFKKGYTNYMKSLLETNDFLLNRIRQKDTDGQNLNNLTEDMEIYNKMNMKDFSETAIKYLNYEDNLILLIRQSEN